MHISIIKSSEKFCKEEIHYLVLMQGYQNFLKY